MTDSQSASLSWCQASIWDQIETIARPTVASCLLCCILAWSLEFFLWPTVSRPVRLGIGPSFGILDQILSCSSSFIWQLHRFAINASSLTRKRVCTRNLLCNCFWASPEQSHLSWRPTELTAISCCLIWFPQPRGPDSRIYIPQEQGGPVIPLGTGFPFCRFLRLAGTTVEVF
jgi:hypothetical protein